MGMNAGECRQMVEAAKKAKLLLGVAQVFRFENSTARLRDHVAAGDVGRVIFARSEFSYLGRAHARKWINERTLAGGGPIADVGVHCVDALRFILQDEVQTVSASANSDKDSKDVEASAALALKFQSGTLAAVLVSMRADYRTPMEIVGEEAVLRADPALSVEEPIKIELRRGGKVEKTEDVSNKLAYARQVDAFADAVEGKAPFPVPGEEGWKNQLVLDAAYRSITGGRTEEVGKI
jgi:1,5-anhydro-D-fructose reductase (1,5-anhydro-D-mannitol-forming)